MRVPPASLPSLAERHVQFSEFVDMRAHSMTDTQMTTIIGPSMHAQRLERMIRAAEVFDTPVPQAEPEIPRHVRLYKRTCDTASLLCGAAAIPSIGLAALGPVWLVTPAVLLVASLACYYLRGSSTPQAEQEYALRRVSARAHDCEGV